MSDVLRGVRSVTSEEVAPLMLARYFADLGARFGAGAATRALAALTQPGTGLTVERGGRSLYPIVAWVEMAPESGVPVVPIPGVEVLDVFYPEEPATAIPRHEHASMWLWMTGIVAGALAIVHFGARRG